MRVAAERISTEIQIHTSNRRLEEMVETRTADLTAALDRLRGVNAQLLEASRDTVMRLARAAEYRDGDTGEHVDRMSSYSQAIARQMGMPAEEQGLLKLAAPMHDVGKIGIRDSILLKQGRLTQDEYEQMKEHPTIGARILGGSRAKLLQMAEQIAFSHHEHRLSPRPWRYRHSACGSHRCARRRVRCPDDATCVQGRVECRRRCAAHPT
jgi:putative two-component system response regulator